MNYAQISKTTIATLYKTYNSLDESPLDLTIRRLVELRTSQINGCAFCCSLHSKEARDAGITQEKLDALPAWHTAHIFSVKEIAALQWCEELTCLTKDNKIDQRKLLEPHFSEREIVDLTACISIMNAFNRIAIGLKD